MTPEPYASIIRWAQFNIIVSVVNMLTSCALIYCAVLARKTIRLSNETRRLLDERASAIDARERRNRETGFGPEGESAVAKPDAQTP